MTTRIRLEGIRRSDVLAARRQEVEVISYALCQPQVSKQLKEMPDLEALLKEVQLNLTVGGFLEDNQVPHTPRQISDFDYDLKRFLFSNEVSYQIRFFLRKATFSRWIYIGTNWYGVDQKSIAKAFNRSVAFIYSADVPVVVRDKVYAMRSCLGGAINQEPIDANNTSIFDSFMQEYIEGRNALKSQRRRLAEDEYKGLFYSSKSKLNWISKKLIFLENVLHLKPDEQPSWDNLTVDRRESLRLFRSVFQQALPNDRQEVIKSLVP